jgi:RNA polymerase sigma factor (sigma-70 family)
MNQQLREPQPLLTLPGDPKTHIENFFNEKLEALEAFAYMYVKNADVAKDMVSEAFLRVLRAGLEGKINSYEAPALSAYIYRAVRNLCFDHIKKKKPESIDEASLEPADDNDHYSLPSDLSDDVRLAVRQLPDHYRVLIYLCDLEDLSYEEVAETLNIPVGTVKSRMNRARQQLRSHLQKYQKGRGFKPDPDQQRPKQVLPGKSEPYSSVTFNKVVKAAVEVQPATNERYVRMLLTRALEQFSLPERDRPWFQSAVRKVFKSYGGYRVAFEVRRFNTLTGKSPEWNIEELEAKMEVRLKEMARAKAILSGSESYKRSPDCYRLVGNPFDSIRAHARYICAHVDARPKVSSISIALSIAFRTKEISLLNLARSLAAFDKAMQHESELLKNTIKEEFLLSVLNVTEEE